MAELTIMECATYEASTRTWDGPESDTRMLWQLLGQLDADEVLVQLPEWLAKEKVGNPRRSTPIPTPSAGFQPCPNLHCGVRVGSRLSDLLR